MPTKKITKPIKKEISDLAEKFGDDRKTKVVAHGVKEFSVEDLVPNEEAVVMMTRDGYIKRTSPDTFKVQGRGGKGVRVFSKAGIAEINGLCGKKTAGDKYYGQSQKCFAHFFAPHYRLSL